MFEPLSRFPTEIFSEFARMQREMDQVLGAFSAPSSIRAVARGSFPAVNIGATPASYEVYAFIPGIEPDSLEVSVDRGQLTIAGGRMPPRPEGKIDVYAKERYTGEFKRVVNLPDDADPTRIEARCRDGVLRVSVPRAEAAQPRRIEVQ